MTSIFKKIGLFISSFIPLYFLIIVKELIEIFNHNLTFNITNSVMLGFNAVLIILGLITVFLCYFKGNYARVEILSIKNQTADNFLPYFPLFVLFALAFELEYISMAVVYVLILVMIAVVYIKNDMLYINPFLNIIGFSSFEVEIKKEGQTFTMHLFKRSGSDKNLKTNDLFLKN